MHVRCDWSDIFSSLLFTRCLISDCLQFVMLQLVLASILQILRDPFSKVIPNNLTKLKIKVLHTTCILFQDKGLNIFQN